MNGVLGLTELLLQSEPTNEQREHLELISRSGRSLLTIISDVLNLTSLAGDSSRRSFKPTNHRPVGTEERDSGWPSRGNSRARWVAM
jgi:signal transduction histidine kinase